MVDAFKAFFDFLWIFLQIFGLDNFIGAFFIACVILIFVFVCLYEILFMLCFKS